MKIVSYKQGSKEWREWRGRGLGASDVPAVMGESPWTSPFELWLDKTGLYPRPPANEFQVAAMKRGNELEPIARTMFEAQMGLQYPSVSTHHEQYEFLRASFDGYCESDNSILEIKCPGKVDHEKALKGRVPKKYIDQMQQQLLISGARIAYYFSWDGKSNKGITIEVKPDNERHNRLLAECIDFWKRVLTLTPPDVTSEDVNKLVMQMNKDLDRVNKAGKVLDLLTKPTKQTDKGLKEIK